MAYNNYNNQSQYNTLDGVQIKQSDIPPALQREAISEAKSAINRGLDDIQVAAHLRRVFNERHGSNWHCIVGRSFGGFNSASSLDELHAVILSLAPQLESKYGLLCFLYSVLANHGLASLTEALADDDAGLEQQSSGACLIDRVHGQANQLLINLLVTGQCVSQLFDGQNSALGLALKGISSQPRIGFLTLFEALRYCEVGWFLKNPSFPIWLLGSETHLTVLASPDMGLVVDAEPQKRLREAERLFESIATSDSGFIASDKLPELLSGLKLDVVTSASTSSPAGGNRQQQKPSIDSIRKQLDPEELGIILEQPFLQLFFPRELAQRNQTNRRFKLIHYNGLRGNVTNGEVRYRYGQAQITDPTDDQSTSSSPGNKVSGGPIHRCLKTKWPTIRVEWDGSDPPSLY